MTEIKRLAARLAHDGADGEQMHRLLRWSGVRGTTVQFYARFTRLADLAPEFQEIGAALPSLAPSIGRVLQASLVLGRLGLHGTTSSLSAGAMNAARRADQDLGAPSDPELARWRAAGPNWPECREGASAAHRLTVAAVILLHLTWDGFDEILGDARSVLSEMMLAMRASARDLAAEAVTLDSLREEPGVLGAIEMRLNAWVETEAYRKDDARAAVAEFCRLLRETRFSSPWVPELGHGQSAPSQISSSARSKPRARLRKKDRKSLKRWGNRASVELHDRELLPESLHAWRADDLEALKRLQRREIGQGVAATAALTLSLLASVALATGRRLQDAGTMRCVPVSSADDAASDSLPDDCLVMLNEDRRTVFWRTPDFSRTRVLLRLRRGVIVLPSDCIDFEIQELLPRPLEDCFPEIQWLAEREFARTAADLDLCIKHALARGLFSHSANRAVIRFVCGAQGTQDTDQKNRSALHHYVHPMSVCVLNAFGSAIDEIFLDEGDVQMHGHFAPVTCSDDEACMHIPSAAMGRVAKALRGCAKDAQRPVPDQTRLDQLALWHNAVARYTAALLVAATGHRVAAQLFHFHFSLDLRSRLAFLSDKQSKGTEARFVPLPAIAVAQLEEYRRHLLWLIQQLEGVDETLARAVQRAVGLASRSAGDSHVRAGFFFTIDGRRLQSIGTDAIDAAIRAACAAEPFDTRAMRRNYATFLANREVPGMAIELALGQVSELHPVGPASCWIPGEVFDGLRPLVDRYMQVNDWQLLKAHDDAPPARRFRPLTPSLQLSCVGFEGRYKLAEAACARARNAVVSVLESGFSPEDVDLIIDDEARRWLADGAREILAGDSAAQAKIEEAMALLAKRWRDNSEVRVTAAAVNRIRTEAGPVSVAFGRWLAVASDVLDWLPLQLARSISQASPENRRLRFLSVATIVLICCDGVLNVDELRELVCRLEEGRLDMHRGQYHLQAIIETRFAVYERSVQTSTKASAVLLGLLKASGKDSLGKSIDWQQIASDADHVLCEFNHGGKPLTLTDLLSIMKPYWFLRVSGSSFSTMTAQYTSSSGCDVSLRQLAGAPAPMVKDAPVRRLNRMIAADEPVDAAAALEKFRRDAEGKREKLEGSSRANRRRLRRQFSGEPNAVLVALMAEQPVVALWYEYLCHMLEEGGIRVAVYSFDTIKSFQTKLLKPLLKEAWGIDLLALRRAEFDALYSRVMQGVTESSKPQALTALRGFHRYLRAVHRVASCAILRSKAEPPEPRNCRNVVLGHEVVEAAVDACLVREDLGEAEQLAAAGLIELMSGEGLRTMEAYGTCWNDVGESSTLVRRNLIRGMKTTERQVVLRARLATEGAVKRLCVRARHAGNDTASRALFRDAEKPAELLNYNKIVAAASQELKLASGNPMCVPYSLRHSYATGMLVHVLEPNPQSPFFEDLIGRLLEPRGQRGCFPNPSSCVYPLQVDRLAMSLGHSTATLHQTYWHGAWWVVSERCYRAAVAEPWSDVVMAVLSGMSRTNLVKRRGRVLRSRAGDDMDDQMPEVDDEARTF